MATKKEHKPIDEILDLSETVENDLYMQFEDLNDFKPDVMSAESGEDDKGSAQVIDKSKTEVVHTNSKAEHKSSTIDNGIVNVQIPIPRKDAIVLSFICKYLGKTQKQYLVDVVCNYIHSEFSKFNKSIINEFFKSK